MIDFLIPTYNRAHYLIKNLKLIDELVRKEAISEHFRILVSDNCSTDNTFDAVEKLKSSLRLDVALYCQKKNIGLERNAIFLLEKATSEFIMYVGDDDYLPPGYLKFIIYTIKTDPDVSAVIPGNSSLYADGAKKPARTATFDVKKYQPSFSTAKQISYLGHQLSGVLFRREKLAEAYLESEDLRNIYPFIFFLAFNNLRGSSYYAPKFKVLVSIDNSKNWKYDNSGLLQEIFKNFAILYPHQPVKRFLLCFAVMQKQSWRLRIGKNLINAFKAFSHLFFVKNVDLLVKLSLFGLFPYLYTRRVLSFIRRRLL